MGPKARNIRKIGYWSSFLTVVFSISYAVLQIAAALEFFVSPWDQIALFVPSFFLASSFLVLNVSIYHYASEERKIWGHIGLAFAALYAILVSTVYFVELTVVIPRIFQGSTAEIALLLFQPGSFMVAVDGLGYGFMSLSTLFAAQVFQGGKLERWTRLALTANGLLAPVILLAVIYPMLVVIGALWLITFPLSAILLWRIFSHPAIEKHND
ncbi:MAG TPA: hypothetical protein VLB04_04200 [Methanotrichaceae archaeon]|nr:hypothetical protein [Methanotrichaceae archaeon]